MAYLLDFDCKDFSVAGNISVVGNKKEFYKLVVCGYTYAYGMCIMIMCDCMCTYVCFFVTSKRPSSICQGV